MDNENSSFVDDLLYDCGPAKEIQSVFPRAKLNKVWDEIHADRLEVSIPNCTKEEWWEYLLRSGWGSCSLGFQLTMRMNPKALMEILTRIKKEESDAQG